MASIRVANDGTSVAMAMRMSNRIWLLALVASLTLNACALDDASSSDTSSDETSEVESNVTHPWVYMYNPYWGQYLSLAIAGSHGLLLSSTASINTDWVLDATGRPDEFVIRSYANNLCIWVGTSGDGAIASTATCSGVNTRNLWYRKPHVVNGFTYYYFVNEASFRYCLDTNGGRGSSIGVWDCVASPSSTQFDSQTWKVQ